MSRASVPVKNNSSAKGRVLPSREQTSDRSLRAARRNSDATSNSVKAESRILSSTTSNASRAKQEPASDKLDTITSHSKCAVSTKFDGSSDDSTVTYHSGQSKDRKRPATTDVDEKFHTTAQPKRTRSSSQGRSYNLRSRESSNKSKPPPLKTSGNNNADFAITLQHNTKSSVAVTPAGVNRQINYSEYRKRSLFASNTSGTIIPDNVVDIFSSSFNTNIDAGLRCHCPSSTCRLQLNNDNNIDLTSSYMNDYGLELDAMLREQETKEQSEILSSFPKNRSVSSLSSNSPSSPSVDDESTDESRLMSSDEEDSTLGTPRPGTVLNHSLREMSLKVSRLNSTLSINDATPLHRQPYITPKMRNILVNWLGEVALEYKVSDEALHLSVTILDAVLSKGPSPKDSIRHNNRYDDSEDDNDSDSDDSDKENKEPKDFTVYRSDFQALGCACLWIASKVQDKNPPCADDFVYISDYSFTANKLLALEAKVCKYLGFRFQRVTPVHFLTLYLKASQACPNGRYCHYENSVLRHLCMYLLELSRLSYDLIGLKPSLVAAATVYLARATIGIRETNPDHKIDENGYWTSTLAHYTGYTVKELRQAVLCIQKYQMTVEGSETLTASFSKFKKSYYRGVSLKTVPSIESLGFGGPPVDENLIP